MKSEEREERLLREIYLQGERLELTVNANGLLLCQILRSDVRDPSSVRNFSYGRKYGGRQAVIYDSGSEGAN